MSGFREFGKPFEGPLAVAKLFQHGGSKRAFDGLAKFPDA